MNNRYRFGVAALVAVVLSADGVRAGDLTPPGPPASTMRTLQEIYDKQDATHQLVEAFVSPRTISDTTTVVNAGYYAATNLTQVDADLTAANIRKDVAMFGVTGTYEGGGDGTYNAPVPKTGQTTSYATRDDGDLEKGVAWLNPRFTDNGNGTVTDNMTGLIWLRNANAFGLQIWATTLTNCATLKSGEAGLSDGSVEGDWRLPNVREMQSLFDYGRFSPALPSGHPFTSVQTGYYWSSSTYAGDRNRAWHVYLYDGFVYDGIKTSTFYAWPVRGGQ